MARFPVARHAVLIFSALSLPVFAAELHLNSLDESGAPVWTRFEVRGPGGQMYQPANALRDSTVRNREGGQPWYIGSFVAKGDSVLEVPPGSYIVVAERGPEFVRFQETVEVGDAGPARLEVRLNRWIHMSGRGWWSGDLHVHRPMEDTPALLEAEDINLAVVFTMWNKRDLWAGKPFPKTDATTIAPDRAMTVLNAEDERGGGAWMFHGLREKLALGVDGRWFPIGLDFIREAKAQRSEDGLFPWFDCEKPIWWETPVVMALDPPDSFGVLHNHFNQYGIHASEAWGRPRDVGKYPGGRGFVDYSLGLYYKYLNLGFRLPPSAGSASGVLPNPVGYNRTYVRMGPLGSQPFTVENWYAGLRDGESFVTNGPMLFFHAVEQADRVWITINAEARDPIEKVEIIANGKVVSSVEPPGSLRGYSTELSLHLGEHSWVAARCFTKADHTIRMAHSRPVYLPGSWDASEDAAYFMKWIDDLVAISESEQGRFANTEERDAIVAIYRKAREFYAEKARGR